METEQKFIYKLNCYLSHAKESFSALTRLFVSKLVLKLFTSTTLIVLQLNYKDTNLSTFCNFIFTADE